MPYELKAGTSVRGEPHSLSFTAKARVTASENVSLRLGQVFPFFSDAYLNME